MTSMGTFDVISVRGDGFWTDKAKALPLTDEQIGFPFRSTGPETEDNNVLQEVVQSANGEYIVAAFGNGLKSGSGVHISPDRGLTWKTTSLNIDTFESFGVRISPDGQVIAVIGWSIKLNRNCYISNDGGDSWSSSETTLNAEMMTSSSGLDHIYITQEGVDDAAAYIIVSHDRGQNFHKIAVNYTSFYMWTSITASADGAK